MAGALTERDFVAKLERAGLAGVEVLERTTLGVNEIALYPLFTDDLLALMRRLLTPERQAEVAVAVVVRARRPAR